MESKADKSDIEIQLNSKLNSNDLREKVTELLRDPSVTEVLDNKCATKA